jgi:hypothetical protein
MDQGSNIQLVAEQMVRSLGPRAFAHLYELGEMAQLSGDRESAITWWDIALAVIEIRKSTWTPAMG